MTKTEIIEKISEYIRDNGAYDYPEVEGVIFKSEESFGGEGQGDHAHEVWKVKVKNIEDFFVKIDGYYTSYDGTDWDSDAYEVEPFMKEVRDWKPVK